MGYHQRGHCECGVTKKIDWLPDQTQREKKKIYNTEFGVEHPSKGDTYSNHGNHVWHDDKKSYASLCLFQCTDNHCENNGKQGLSYHTSKCENSGSFERNIEVRVCKNREVIVQAIESGSLPVIKFAEAKKYDIEDWKDNDHEQNDHAWC